MAGRRCPCSGNWKSRMARWVAVERRPNGWHRLYCLDCRWRWLSRCRYASCLNDHTPRSRKGMTNEDILHRLFVSKDLRINPRTAVVETRAGKNGAMGTTWRALKQVPDKHDSGYRFVSISFGGRKKKIAVHVLQWMAANHCVVPDGYDVHHVKSPPRPHPKPNNIDNLELMESSINQSMGYVPF